MGIVTGNKFRSGFVFDVFNTIFLGTFAVLAILPFFYILAGSFASTYEFKTRAFFLIPRSFNIQSYIYIFSSATLVNSFLVSLTRTILGAAISMFFTLTMAYPLSKKRLPGRDQILNAVVFCMLFSGGMIPLFLVVRGLHIFDTIWALVLPGAISISNMIVIKTFFQGMSQELEEAAKIDGCNDLHVFLRIVLPLSLPVIATFTLFYAVGQWNAFFDALIFINKQSLWPLQLVLRQLVMMAQGTIGNSMELDPYFGTVPEEGMKMAVIVVSTVPILLVYPFLQQYFAKGALIGAIKG